VILVSTGVRAPDGGALFQNLNTSFDSERVGLVGANGTGKTTLLDLIASKRLPDEGHVAVHGRVWRLEQQLTPDEGATVADALGVAGTSLFWHAFWAATPATTTWVTQTGRWKAVWRRLWPASVLKASNHSGFSARSAEASVHALPWPV